MKIKVIDEKTYEKFVINHQYKNAYQSINWLNVKKSEKKKIEILGFFVDDVIVGATFAIKAPILKKFYHIYCSRGIITNYDDRLFVKELAIALKKYYRRKRVIKVTIDPAIILNVRDTMGNITSMNNDNIIHNLEASGFIHYGYNLRFETYQMRFIHRLKLQKTYEEQEKQFSKSTKKNIETAISKGVYIELGTKKDLEKAVGLFDQTANRKHITNYDIKFYERIMDSFKNDAVLYLTYIDKNVYLNNMRNILQTKENDLKEIENKKRTCSVGANILRQESIAKEQIDKYKKEVELATELEEKTLIASLFSIYCYDEYISFASGMDNNYRSFCPKYAMYPRHIKDAIDRKMNYVNFLGVTGIFDKEDKDFGIYDIKRGFGGQTVEYIGEFTLPINKTLYKISKLLGR